MPSQDRRNWSVATRTPDAGRRPHRYRRRSQPGSQSRSVWFRAILHRRVLAVCAGKLGTDVFYPVYETAKHVIAERFNLFGTDDHFPYPGSNLALPVWYA